MHVDTDADVLRLRAGLRDLVALSAIPAVWIGSEPLAVATGLADALVGLLQLDFAFVRLCDPGGAGAVDVTRGSAWTTFPQWLEDRLGTSAPFPRKEVVPDIDRDSPPRRGLVVPVGVNGEGGVVAAASERSDFPTPMDQLLLSLAANHAATAFQSARLVHERRRAEEELRNARDQLEVKVAERTAELGRSEAYLAEAQRLTDTGSFAIDVSTREVTHASDEHLRLYGLDPGQGIPSLSEFLQRIHPQDRAMCTEALERGIREATNIEVEYRVVLPRGPVRRHRAIAHQVFDASGELDELVGTIVDVTERRQAEAELERLAGEQAALRRVATLVARGAASEEVFAAVTEEARRLLSVKHAGLGRYEPDGAFTIVAWSGTGDLAPPVGTRQMLGGKNVTTLVFETGRPARIDDYGDASGPVGVAAREDGVGSGFGTPVIVEGHLWGMMAAYSALDQPLPPDTDARLASFTELVATAIANAESRAGLARLAEEQAALRRVATLVARGVPPEEVFAAVSEEVGQLLPVDYGGMGRYEPDGTISVLGRWGRTHFVPLSIRLGRGDHKLATIVFETGRPARVDSYADASGPFSRALHERGVRSAVGTPIVVEGRLWGLMSAGSTLSESLPADTEARLASFTELVATAIANAEARAEVERLADEQAALRRVATLVAQGASATAVFDAVAAEMERLLNADQVVLGRYEPGDEVTVVAHRGASAKRVPPGTRVSHEGENVQAVVRRTERPGRIENFQGAEGTISQLARTVGVRVVVGAPIVVDGRLWGVISASWNREESPPIDTEERMAQFAQLLDTAIANADTRDQLMASRARLLTEGDEARRRVVRDLHDGAQQRLVHTIVMLKLAQRSLREEDEKAESLVGEALEHAERGNAELRELAHGILPAVLTRGGLGAGLDALVARLDLPVDVDVLAERFPAEIEASAYFIVAEALTNVVKHAHADRAEVTASVRDGTLHIEVRDDGIGGADPAGHGLVGMGDRVTALGGRLKIESPAGGGTVVTATLPLPASERHSFPVYLSATSTRR
jgi:GAF domain-containing protein